MSSVKSVGGSSIAPPAPGLAHFVHASAPRNKRIQRTHKPARLSSRTSSLGPSRPQGKHESVRDSNVPDIGIAPAAELPRIIRVDLYLMRQKIIESEIRLLRICSRQGIGVIWLQPYKLLHSENRLQPSDHGFCAAESRQPVSRFRPIAIPARGVCKLRLHVQRNAVRLPRHVRSKGIKLRALQKPLVRHSHFQPPVRLARRPVRRCHRARGRPARHVAAAHRLTRHRFCRTVYHPQCIE